MTYGRQFAAYRWFKPIIVGLLFAFFYLILAVILAFGMQVVLGYSTGGASGISDFISTGYDDFNITDWQGALLNLGVVAVMIPALFIARLIVRDRPFTSYSSARGGWSNRVFFTCLLVSIVCIAIPIVVHELMQGRSFVNKFTLASFIVLTIIGPLQCIAEEYIFRGLLMQTLGSWVRIPVIAVILQSLVFVAMHPYNMIGKAEIFISGIMFGLAAWIGRGIEASSALHIANNMTTFYLVGLNLSEIGSEVEVESLIFSAVIYTLYVAVIYIISRKTKLFDRIKKEDAAAFNEKYVTKKRKKAAAKGKTYEPPAGIPLGKAAEEPSDYESGYLAKH